MPDKDSLFDTILVVANDQFVSFFLKNEIKFTHNFNILKSLFISYTKWKSSHILVYKKMT